MRELIGRRRRAGARNPMTLWADSGFWSAKVVEACRGHDVRYSMTVNQLKVKEAIADIDEAALVPTYYTAGGKPELPPA